MYLTEIRGALELVYFISGPLLVLVALVGLRQIVVTRAIARDSSRREACRLTMELQSFYCNVIMPRYDKLNALSKNAHLALFEKSHMKRRGADIDVRFDVPEQAMEDLKANYTDIVVVLNDLNSLANHFIFQIADAELGFFTLASPFCQSVEWIYPALLLIRRSTGGYQAIVDLYVLWSTQLEQLRIMPQELQTKAAIRVARKSNL